MDATGSDCCCREDFEDWSFKFDEELQQYIALDSEMELQVDEFNEHWDTFRAGWQAAKADTDDQITVSYERLQELIAIGVKAALDEREQK